MIKKGEDGVYLLAYPVGDKAKFPLVDTESDIGKSQDTAYRSSRLN